MAIIITGSAGFIGYSVSRRLLERGETVLGIDNFNEYYDPSLKRARTADLLKYPRFTLHEGDIADSDSMAALFKQVAPRQVIHLAAQAGVRHSIDNPFAYERANLLGHLSILEACRQAGGAQHLVYASSSSVYGNRSDGGAFAETDAVDEPASLYAATKRAGELMSITYAQLYGLAQTGLRFFTVYGPWGRPDMAYFSFTRKILAGEPIEVFGNGEMGRDFTYIDDIVDGVIGVLDHPPATAAHRLFNIGNNHPVGLMHMIEVLEQALGQPAVKVMQPMQPGDVAATFADIAALHALTGYAPKVSLEQGLPRFVKWYRDRYPA